MSDKINKSILVEKIESFMAALDDEKRRMFTEIEEMIVGCVMDEEEPI